MRIQAAGAISIALLLSNGSTASAQEKPDEVPPAPPPVHDVIARGSLAIVAQPGALVLYDITDPANPRVTGKLSRPGDVWAVALEGELAYVAVGSRGVAAVSLSRPEEPRLVGVYDTVGSARAVAVRGGVVAVADRARGLEIVSFADPARPRSLATLPSRDATRGVAWRGTILASAEGNAGVRLLDVTNPGAPKRLSQVERPLPALDAALCDGNLLLVAAGEAGLRVWDVSEPARPVEAGSLALEGRVRSVSCAGKLAAAGCGDHGVALVDLSAPGRPRILGRVDRLGGYPAERVFLTGKLVLIAAGAGGLGALSIEDPTAPILLLPRARKMRITFP